MKLFYSLHSFVWKSTRKGVKIAQLELRVNFNLVLYSGERLDLKLKNPLTRVDFHSKSCAISTTFRVDFYSNEFGEYNTVWEKL